MRERVRRCILKYLTLRKLHKRKRGGDNVRKVRLHHLVTFLLAKPKLQTTPCRSF